MFAITASWEANLFPATGVEPSSDVDSSFAYEMEPVAGVPPLYVCEKRIRSSTESSPTVLPRKTSEEITGRIYRATARVAMAESQRRELVTRIRASVASSNGLVNDIEAMRRSVLTLVEEKDAGC